ncbi:Diguanylate cyclase/phosphodiesterase domain 1 [Bacillus thuringiensis serovar tochigiensis BGSC 4Y1]|nr:Diguanylate cyclase/phosphodiesterase domain 1 [Bacillus thuringiensis serovar tochigiensis BGSC 4Y1]
MVPNMKKTNAVLSAKNRNSTLTITYIIVKMRACSYCVTCTVVK